MLYALGEPILGSLIALAGAGFALIYGLRRFYSTRFIYPGIVAIVLFVVFPVAYTIYLGFTNYSSFNLLTFERAQRVHLSSVIVAPDTERPFALVSEDGAYRVFLPDRDRRLPLRARYRSTAPKSRSRPSPSPPRPPKRMAMRDVVPLRDNLSLVTVTLPDGTELKQSGLRTFASVTSEYELQPDGTLVSNIDGCDPDAGPLARLLRQRRGRRRFRPAGASTSASTTSSASSRPKASARRCSRSSSGR